MNSSDHSIRAMILAGGLGTRLRSVVSDRPKPLAMIGDTPFLEILIDSLAAKGLYEFVLLIGYMGEMIRDHIRHRYGDELTFMFSQEETPLGTGGPVKLAGAYASDPTILVNGDTFFDADISSLIEFHSEKGADVTLSLVEVDDASRYGAVEVDEDGKIIRFKEKDEGSPGRGLINAGVTALSKRFIESLPSDGPFSMERDIYPSIISQGVMYGLPQQKTFYDIGTPESYEAFAEYVSKELKNNATTETQ